MNVSIHAPLARCDFNGAKNPPPSNVSIHAPLARCDLLKTILIWDLMWFQFTHLLRGATY